MPRLAVTLVCVALVTAVLCAAFTLRVNPEIRLFRSAYAKKKSWAAHMDAQFTNKVVLCGGSSCGTSVDPERLLGVHGMPAANYGLGAGMGVTLLARAAMSGTRPGDTFVLAIEPGLLSESFDFPSLACQFAVAEGHVDWLTPLVGAPPSRAQVAVALRPGGYYTFTLLGKVILGKRLYRYEAAEIHPGGWHEVPVRLPLVPGEVAKPLSADGRQFIKALAAWAGTNHVKLVYSMPRAYIPAERLATARQTNARWLLSIKEVMPVLRDEFLGADPDETHFADMNLHPTRTGAEMRTDRIARALKEGDVWGRDELLRISSE